MMVYAGEGVYIFTGYSDFFPLLNQFQLFCFTSSNNITTYICLNMLYNQTRLPFPFPYSFLFLVFNALWTQL